jgi:hypothetical protein
MGIYVGAYIFGGGGGVDHNNVVSLIVCESIILWTKPLGWCLLQYLCVWFNLSLKFHGLQDIGLFPEMIFNIPLWKLVSTF